MRILDVNRFHLADWIGRHDHQYVFPRGSNDCNEKKMEKIDYQEQETQSGEGEWRDQNPRKKGADEPSSKRSILLTARFRTFRTTSFDFGRIGTSTEPSEDRGLHCETECWFVRSFFLGLDKTRR